MLGSTGRTQRNSFRGQEESKRRAWAWGQSWNLHQEGASSSKRGETPCGDRGERSASGYPLQTGR